MKILHTVQNYWPDIGGMAEAARRISEGLVRCGHEVHVATSTHPQRQARVIDGVQVHAFDIAGSMVHGYRGDLRPYRELVRDGGFDVVTNFAGQQWATDALLPILPELSARKVFVPTGFSGLFWPEFRDYFRQMPEWMRQYDLNIFLSDRYRDAEFARAHGITHRTVIPNGAAADEFAWEDLPDIRAELNIPSEHFLVVHVGSHTGLKGHAEAIAIFALARLRAATFLLIGNPAHPPCLARCRKRQQRFPFDPRQWGRDKRLLLAELTREQTVAALKAADLFLFPSQLECSPLVLFECLAAATPFLATEVGNVREIAEVTGGGLVVPTRVLADGLGRAEVRESACQLEALWSDPERRWAMAAQGHAVWQAKFTWEQIAGRYEQAYRELLAGRVDWGAS